MKSALFSIVAGSLFASPALAQTTWIPSVSPGGTLANAACSRPALDASGRYLVFESSASNLVANDGNGHADIFLRDLHRGTTSRVSLGLGGVDADLSSSQSAISGDGRIVAFSSWAKNLVAGSSSGELLVYVVDTTTGITEIASLNSSGEQADYECDQAVLSHDGRYVAFRSGALNLTFGHANALNDIFVRDRATGQTTCVSENPSGHPGNGGSAYPAISADGRYVVFHSNAADLVAGDTNGVYDVFRHDRDTDTTIRISESPSGFQSSVPSREPSISADGNRVAFRGDSMLLAGGTPLQIDVFVRDVLANTLVRASVDSNGTVADLGSSLPALSADGLHVAFVSDATNLAPPNTGSMKDDYVHHLATGITERVTVSSAGVQANLHASTVRPTLSADGRYVAFDSQANNLVAGLTPTTEQVYLRDTLGTPPVVYCTAKVNSLGCTPALSVFGAPSLSSSSPAPLTATGLIAGKFGLFVHSTAAPTVTPFHGGWLCVGTPLVRHDARVATGASGTCANSASEDLSAYLASGADPALVAGTTASFQHWSRDNADPFGDSLSDAVQLTVLP